MTALLLALLGVLLQTSFQVFFEFCQGLLVTGLLGECVIQLR